ncbi:hypothetical protein ACFLS1_12545 [Verrucomicrobiota bacterium]
MNVDPSGLGLTIAGKMTLVLVIGILSALIVPKLLQTRRGLIAAGITANALPIGGTLTAGSLESLDDERAWNGLLERLTHEIHVRWGPSNEKHDIMDEFSVDLECYAFSAFFLTQAGSEWVRDSGLDAFAYHLNFGPWDSNAYIRRDIFTLADPTKPGIPIPDSEVLRLLLMIYAEYQHSSLNPTGRKSDEDDAQDEFEEIRDAMDNFDSTHPEYSEIMKLKHGR